MIIDMDVYLGKLSGKLLLNPKPIHYKFNYIFLI
jgi:hypothetical protein